jgi:predicted permease
MLFLSHKCYKNNMSSAARHDLRYALRGLARTPGFTAVAVVTLALGIGATTAIFSVVHGVLLKPFGYQRADRLVRLYENVPASENAGGRPRRRSAFSRAEFGELQRRARTLSHVAGHSWSIMTLTGRQEATRVQVAPVSPEIFTMVGASPLVGRLFDAGDAARGAAVAVLSHRLWQQQFGGDPEVVGRAVTLHGVIPRSDAKSYTVIGIVSPAFQFPFADSPWHLWIPMPAGGSGVGPIVARLADDSSMATAATEAAAIVLGVRGHPEAAAAAQAATPPRFEFVRMQDEVVAPVKPALIVLMTAVGFVLLIACVNVANLLLARTSARQRDIAIRIALGAGRGHIIRYLLAESAVLASLGGVAGTALAIAGVRVLRVLAATIGRIDLSNSAASFPRLDEVGLDPAVLAFTIGVSLLTALVCGLVPALRHSRLAGFDLRPPIRVRGALVVAEIAMAMVLLVAGGLLMRSFVKLATVDPGFAADHVVTFQIALPNDRYPAARLKALAEDVVERLRAIPGVRSAAYANQLPFVSLRDTAGGLRRTPDPQAPPPPDGADARFVSRDYLHVMGIRVTAGRGLSERDGEGQPRVVVINEALARRDFPGENPIGQTVYVGRRLYPWQVVGVVEDVRQFGLDRPPEPQFFADMRQWPETGLLLFPVGAYYALRIDGESARVIANVRRIVREVDAEAGLFNVAGMDQLVAATIARPRMYAVLLAIFAGVGVLLAAVGIYGVLACSVAQRTREIGIRVALGAERSAVIALVLRESAVLTSVGIALGVGGAAGLTRYLATMLFGLTRPRSDHVRRGVGVVCRRRRARVLDAGSARDRGRSDDRASLRLAACIY